MPCLCCIDPEHIRNAGRRSFLSQQGQLGVSLNSHSAGFWQLEKCEKCMEHLMAASGVPGMAAHMGLGVTLPGTLQWFSRCPHAHILQEIQKVYCGPLKRCLWNWSCKLGPGEPSQDEPGHSCLSQGSSGLVGSHLSLCLLSCRAQHWLRWGTESCWDRLFPRDQSQCCGLGSQIHTRVLGTSSLSPILHSLFLFLAQPLSALSHALVPRSASDTRSPGKPQQPGWGPGLRVPRRQRELDRAAGFPPLLHRILRGPWKRLEVSLQGLHQRRRYLGILWSTQSPTH